MTLDSKTPIKAVSVDLRAAGFSGWVGERSSLELELLCAFNGVDPSDAPAAWRFHPNESTQNAWRRVVAIVAAAERRGAEGMRKRCAEAAIDSATGSEFRNGECNPQQGSCGCELSSYIRALPLPGDGT